jgi:cell division transport system permease protein
MTFAKALLYFLREATQNLYRSWRVSLLAVLTIGVSLFVGGAFLLVSGNLAIHLDSWRAERKVIVYFEPTAPAQEVEALAAEARREPWLATAVLVAPAEAKERFEALFPSLADLAADQGPGALPTSLELTLKRGSEGSSGLGSWLERVRTAPSVSLVEDDRDWLAQVSTAVALGRALGLVLGVVLLGGAVFTIASVVRLTAYLYSDEIAIMRLVGATEFFIRGPFYAEGLLQGLFGGLVAGGALYLAFETLVAKVGASFWGELLLRDFLAPLELLGLVGFGALAGLAGAILSLRRERLGAAEVNAAE